MKNQILDISPTLRARTAVFPGDTPFSRSVLMSFSQGHHLELSRIESTLHIGAHADAPSHYHAEGVSIEKRPLNRYLGRCQVIEIKNLTDERIMLKHLNGQPIHARRVLFKTRSFPNPDSWQDRFCSLSPDLINYLASQQVQLVGIDTPSVDPSDSKALESHQALYKGDFAVLEGLVLDEVMPGNYGLIALPLKLESADASPVRAVLVPEQWLGEELE